MVVTILASVVLVLGILILLLNFVISFLAKPDHEAILWPIVFFLAAIAVKYVWG